MNDLDQFGDFLSREALRVVGSRVEALQFPKGVAANRACSIGGAIKRLVVDHNDFSVPRGANVEFQAVRSIANCLTERGKGILRGDSRRAAMCDDQHERTDVISMGGDRQAQNRAFR